MPLDDRDVAVTDQRGRLKVPGIHDARLSALTLDFGKRLCFDAAGANGERSSFVLDGLYMLNISDLWDGVIVDSISMWRLDGGDGARWSADAGRAWTSLLSGRVDPGSEAREIERMGQKHRRLTLVDVSCSYGGAIQALCRDLFVNDREVTPG